MNAKGEVKRGCAGRQLFHLARRCVDKDLITQDVGLHRVEVLLIPLHLSLPLDELLEP